MTGNSKQKVETIEQHVKQLYEQIESYKTIKTQYDRVQNTNKYLAERNEELLARIGSLEKVMTYDEFMQQLEAFEKVPEFEEHKQLILKLSKENDVKMIEELNQISSTNRLPKLFSLIVSDITDENEHLTKDFLSNSAPLSMEYFTLIGLKMLPQCKLEPYIMNLKDILPRVTLYLGLSEFKISSSGFQEIIKSCSHLQNITFTN